MKKIKIIGVVLVFLITVLYHYLYEWLPNPLFSIFFPVNESIWEHMKLLYSGFLTWGIIEYFILKKNNIKFTNYFSSLFLTMIISILLYLIIYLPLYNLFGENIVLSISLLIIVIVIMVIINYFLITRKIDNKTLNIIGILLIIVGYFVFLAFTYNPPKNYIFYDIKENKYGINNYYD